MRSLTNEIAIIKEHLIIAQKETNKAKSIFETKKDKTIDWLLWRIHVPIVLLILVVGMYYYINVNNLFFSNGFEGVIQFLIIAEFCIIIILVPFYVIIGIPLLFNKKWKYRVYRIFGPSSAKKLYAIVHEQKYDSYPELVSLCNIYQHKDQQVKLLEEQKDELERTLFHRTKKFLQGCDDDDVKTFLNLHSAVQLNIKKKRKTLLGEQCFLLFNFNWTAEGLINKGLNFLYHHSINVYISTISFQSNFSINSKSYNPVNWTAE